MTELTLGDLLKNKTLEFLDEMGNIAIEVLDNEAEQLLALENLLDLQTEIRASTSFSLCYLFLEIFEKLKEISLEVLIENYIHLVPCTFKEVVKKELKQNDKVISSVKSFLKEINSMIEE